jgi:hypothetical protein
MRNQPHATTARSQWRFLPARVHGRLAFATYLRGDRIAEVVSFLDAEVFVAFGLPTILDPSDDPAAPAGL